MTPTLVLAAALRVTTLSVSHEQRTAASRAAHGSRLSSARISRISVRDTEQRRVCSVSVSSAVSAVTCVVAVNLNLNLFCVLMYNFKLSLLWPENVEIEVLILIINFAIKFVHCNIRLSLFL